MTTPSEEANALLYARLFLRTLLFKDLTPRVPKEVREQARARLRHYPAGFVIKEFYEKKYGKEFSKKLIDEEEVWETLVKNLQKDEDKSQSC